jgi:hypothetical protein
MTVAVSACADAYDEKATITSPIPRKGSLPADVPPQQPINTPSTTSYTLTTVRFPCQETTQGSSKLGV